jgi:2Fe-2S ferredoxin
MPVISFKKKHRSSLTVIPGANLMKSLLDAGIPVASSCGGDGVCGKCRISITEGLHHISAKNETEKFLQEKYQLKADQRISCQSFVLDDVEIDASYW